LPDHPRLGPLRAALDRYGDAGGSLLAGGLAFSALFALVPGLLLAAGLAGLLIGDDARRGEVLADMVRHVPPLRDLLASGLDEVAGAAVPVSLVAGIGLLWGASRFYVTLEAAFARIFTEAPRRGLVLRNAWGFVSVFAFLIAVLVAIVVSGVASFLAESVLSGPDVADAGLWRFMSPIAAAILTAGAVMLVYRAVPSVHPGWSLVVLPGTVVGVMLAILTQAFVYVAPRLVAVAFVFGGLAALFVALAWLSLVFQLLLIGAAWVAVRSRSADRRAGAPP
jgi:membrane protein